MHLIIIDRNYPDEFTIKLMAAEKKEITEDGTEISVVRLKLPNSAQVLTFCLESPPNPFEKDSQVYPPIVMIDAYDLDDTAKILVQFFLANYPQGLAIEKYREYPIKLDLETKMGHEEIQICLFFEQHLLYRPRQKDPSHYRMHIGNETLGSGSFGQVFSSPTLLEVENDFQLKIKEEKGKTPYVIKEIKTPGSKDLEKFKKRVIKEIAITRKANPDAGCKDAIFSENSAYITMKRAPGEELAEILIQVKKKTLFLPVRDRLRLFILMIEKTIELHEREVIHRDLKPENMLLDLSSKPMVLTIVDFGLSKQIQGEKQCKHIAGTAVYLAPEALLEHKYSTASDTFALGLIGSELFGDTRIDILYEQLQHKILHKTELAIIAQEPDRFTDLFAGLGLSDGSEKNLRALFKGMTHWDKQQRISLSDALAQAKACLASYQDEAFHIKTSKPLPIPRSPRMFHNQANGRGLSEEKETREKSPRPSSH